MLAGNTSASLGANNTICLREWVVNMQIALCSSRGERCMGRRFRVIAALQV